MHRGYTIVVRDEVANQIRNALSIALYALP
jgi:hypothetical protein